MGGLHDQGHAQRVDDGLQDTFRAKFTKRIPRKGDRGGRRDARARHQRLCRGFVPGQTARFSGGADVVDVQHFEQSPQRPVFTGGTVQHGPDDVGGTVTKKSNEACVGVTNLNGELMRAETISYFSPRFERDIALVRDSPCEDENGGCRPHP